MKGSSKVIKVLNSLLADELTAISQYMVHAEMCDDWMYQALHEAVEKRAMTEMKHGEDLIARILFLQGTPIVSKLNPMHIGADVPAQFSSDHKAEADAIRAYNDAIKVCGEAGDFGTRQLLQSILKDEEEHIDWIEGQLGLIEQVGLKLYLAQQIKGSS